MADVEAARRELARRMARAELDRRNRGQGPNQLSAVSDRSASKYSGPGSEIKSAMDVMQSVPVAGALFRGIRNTAQGVTELGLEGANALGLVDDQTVSTYKQASDDSRKQYEQTTQGQLPGSDVPGEIMSMLPFSIGAGATTAAGRIAAGVANGALFGATRPIGESENPLVDRASNTGAAALGGGLGAGLLAAGSRLKSGPVDAAKDKARDLLSKNQVRLTPGMKSNGFLRPGEELLESWPGTGHVIRAAKGKANDDFQRAAYNRVLGPIGKTYPKNGALGREGIEALEDTLSQSYEKLLPKMRGQVDPPLAQNLNRIVGEVAKREPQKAKAMVADIESILGKGRFTGQDLKYAQQKIGEVRRKYSKSPSAGDQTVSEAWSAVKSAFDDMLMRANPNEAPKLAKINEGWANFERVRDAATRTGAEEGRFAPGHLLAAVKAKDSSAGKRAFSKNGALLQDLAEAGKTIMGNKVPNSGTPERALLASLLAGPATGAGMGLLSPGVALGLGGAALPYAAPRVAGVVGSGIAGAIRRGSAPAALGLLNSNSQ